MGGTSRGLMAWGALGLLASALVATGCGGSDKGRSKATAGTFAGRVAKTDAFVAITVDPRVKGGERDVRALFYSRRQGTTASDPPINEWFNGKAKGNEVTLASDTGGLLKAKLTASGAKGEVRAKNGRAFSFATGRVGGLAGLYEITVLPSGQLRGTSGSGSRLQARLAQAPSAAGNYPLKGTLTSVDGQSRNFSASFFARPTKAAVKARFIVLPDGEIRGGAKRVRTTTGFTCPMID